jgi:AcrR family transcriptional regulator
MSPDSQRSLRTDARRNRDALVAAAAAVFEESGPDAPLDVVARRAGLGNATLYRHFPTRADLLVAVFAEEVEALRARGEALLAADRPGDALFEWLASFIEHVASKRDLATAVPADGTRSALFDRWHASMREIASALVARARDAGEVAADVDAADLLALSSGIAAGGAAEEQLERLLLLVRRGASVPRVSGRSRS